MPLQNKHPFQTAFDFVNKKSLKFLLDHVIAQNNSRLWYPVLRKVSLSSSLEGQTFTINFALAQRLLASSLLSSMISCFVMFYTGHSICLAKTNVQALSSHQECGQDIFEPNNYRSRARNLSKELKHDREITATICDQDHDWYTVWLNKGELVEFTISSALDETPSLSVYAPRRRKASGILHKISPSLKKLKVYAKKSGRYRLHVKASRKSRSRYTLSYNKPLY